MTVHTHSYPQRLIAEAIGTGLLLVVVIGSGIMAERLANGNAAIALLANALATVGGLFVLIEVFGPVSGAHFNPAVTAVMSFRGQLKALEAVGYVVVQLVAAVAGAWLAHLMFDAQILQLASKQRWGAGLWVAETVATAGLILIILRAPAGRVAAMVAAYIGAAYWFTSSTSFANPAAAFGRMFSDTFAGIAPGSVPPFVAAEFVGAGLGLVLHSILRGTRSPSAEPNVVKSACS